MGTPNVECQVLPSLRFGPILAAFNLERQSPSSRDVRVMRSPSFFYESDGRRLDKRLSAMFDLNAGRNRWLTT
jgi:hypothetical protein